MIVNSEDKQLRLAPDGSISWQKDATNPLPGDVIAAIAKGDTLFSPKIVLDAKLTLDDEARKAVETNVSGWMERHIKFVLEPLFRLEQSDVPEGPVAEIAKKLKDGLGVVPRQDLQSDIAKLDEDGRRILRNKKVRMGPMLVFMPELNKPAAVKLRALLWSLWNKDSVPTDIPSDGIVSFSVEGKEVDENYFRAIGYPVYGPRAVRVDMMDRVVCAVYDAAKDGKFQAQHQMAEWLGSNIAGLYAVLEAMGHIKEHDPLEEKVKAEEAAAKTEAPVEVSVEIPAEASAEVPVEVPAEVSAEAAPAEENPAEAVAAPAPTEDKKPAPAVKPELATFRLKRGKAVESKPAYAGPKKDKYKSDYKSDTKIKTKPKRDFSKGKRPERGEQKERVYTAEAKNVADSPFAILQQLKTGSKDKS